MTEQALEAVRLKSHGHTIGMIAQRMGCPKEDVARWISDSRPAKASPISKYSTELRAEIVKLYEEGLSAGQIGKKLGLSRNAVIGVAHRAGATRTIHPAKPVLRRPVAPSVPRAPNCASKPPRPTHSAPLHFARPDGASGIETGPPQLTDLAPEETPTAKPLNDLGAYDCRWITSGTGESAMFCCKPKWRGSLCEAHHRKGHQSQPPKRLRA